MMSLQYFEDGIIMDLNQLFRKYSKKERSDLLKLGLISSNSAIMQYLASSKEKVSLEQDDLFMICRQGLAQSFQYLKGKINFGAFRQSNTGNTCAHIAGEYGNIQALEYLKKAGFNFGTVNARHQTALAYSLKNNQRSFGSVISFLGRETPLGIRDADNNYSYQVDILLDQSRARLLEWLKQRESGN